MGTPISDLIDKLFVSPKSDLIPRWFDCSTLIKIFVLIYSSHYSVARNRMISFKFCIHLVEFFRRLSPDFADTTTFVPYLFSSRWNYFLCKKNLLYFIFILVLFPLLSWFVELFQANSFNLNSGIDHFLRGPFNWFSFFLLCINLIDPNILFKFFRDISPRDSDLRSFENMQPEH